MHIALNALCITNRSGTGRYVWGLIQGLLDQSAHPEKMSVIIPADFSLPEAWQRQDWVRFYSIPVRSTPLRIVWEQWNLPGLLNWIKPDLLHSPAFIAPVLRRVSMKQIVTIHDLAFLHYPKTIPRLRRWYYRRIIPASWRIADAAIVDSREIGKELEAQMDAPQNIFPVYLGVDRERFNGDKNESDSRILKQYGLIDPFYLFVGTREPRKNLNTLLRAYALARESGLTAGLAIVGRYGWMERHSTTDVNIRWLGHVADTDLPALYRGAQAAVAPSWYEGFDLPSVEARACGTFVIASDIPVHREILGDGARFVACGDVEAWANSLLKLADKKEISSTVRVRSWEEMAEETVQVYQSILSASV